MSAITDLASGEDHRGENFPVASVLIAPRHRPVVLAFYRVARMADDIADHPRAAPQEKLDRLNAIEAALLARANAPAAAVQLRDALQERALTPAHMLDLLHAFRRDVIKPRTADWADLMDYCRYSACPVGRFMLDVHGESRDTWGASDALCTALQIINHLQDCGRDYSELDRVYVPQDSLEAAGLGVETLGAPRASAALRSVLSELAERNGGLLATARSLAGAVRNLRLGLEIGVIQALAQSLNHRLLTRDPLSQRVHHRPIEALGIAAFGCGEALRSRLGLGKPVVLGHS
ncbi:MAG TPA: squalene synthase HpnC [Caulobacteraceae bacterium]